MPKAEGAVMVVAGTRENDGNITNFMLANCLVAALGGLIFGYDSGGVLSRENLLRKLSPSVIDRDRRDGDNLYCKPHNQISALYTSSSYLAAMVSSLFASSVTRAYGRHISMRIGGFIYLVGTLLSAASIHSAMLITGRILVGVGIGFSIQASLIYLSEMAPAYIRGAINLGFQLNVTVGILVANFINYETSKLSGGWGWRLALSVAVIPALVLVVGTVFISDTPNSMLDRSQPTDKAKALLQEIRGTKLVDHEFQDIVFASGAAKKVDCPWTKLLFHPRYRPYLVMCIFIPAFQQLTGINAITFYAPVLYKILGFGHKASLVSSAITGVVNVVSTCVSLAGVDTFGRRPLFFAGGVQMFISQAAVAAVVGIKYGVSGEGSMSKSEADFLLILICCYVAAFAWSWGVLGWLAPSEMCPLEVRSAAQSLNVCVNMLFTFFMAQSSLTMFCHLKFGLFLLFSGFVAIMTVFVFFFVPETKNVRIEYMDSVWREHWFWRRYMPDEINSLDTN